MRGAAAVIGVADHVPTAKDDRPLGYWEVARKVGMDALADAGLTPRDVDGVVFARSGYPLGAPAFTTNFCERMGIRPAWMETGPHGGAQTSSLLWRAALGIAAGLARTVLVVAADTRKTRLDRSGVVNRIAAQNMDPTYEYPHGPIFPSAFALMAQRHMHEFGTTPEQLATVAVSARRWAALHPQAMMQEPLTVQDVLASRPISTPLHLLDICLVTDGGGAMVLTRADHAREISARPVFVNGFGDCGDSQYVTRLRNLAQSDILGRAARTAFGMAGIGPEDVDVLFPYDPSTMHVIWALEQLGFAAPGEGGPLVESGAMLPGGSLPSNTHGGLLAYCHPGMPGALLGIIEAIRQLRGACGDRQVEGAKVAVTTAMGAFMTVGVNVLATEA